MLTSMDRVPVTSHANYPWAPEKRLEVQEVEFTGAAILYNLEPKAPQEGS